MIIPAPDNYLRILLCLFYLPFLQKGILEGILEGIRNIHIRHSDVILSMIFSRSSAV